MVPCVLHSRYCFCLHACLVAHRSRLLESRQQARAFLIACTDLIGWKYLQPFILLPGKKASDADEQPQTGLWRLEFWLLLEQHHQSQQNTGQLGGTSQRNSLLQKPRFQKATRKIMSPRTMRGCQFLPVDCASVWDTI
jgi:hypothetical protein